MAEESKGADNEANKAAAGGDDEEEEGESCCFSYGQCVLGCCKGTFNGIKFAIMACCNCLGLCWYPFKERTLECCDCCGKRMNPHTDPAYQGF